jgi:hypothetical protein
MNDSLQCWKCQKMTKTRCHACSSFFCERCKHYYYIDSGRMYQGHTIRCPSEIPRYAERPLSLRERQAQRYLEQQRDDFSRDIPRDYLNKGSMMHENLIDSSKEEEYFQRWIELKNSNSKSLFK